MAISRDEAIRRNKENNESFNRGVDLAYTRLELKFDSALTRGERTIRADLINLMDVAAMVKLVNAYRQLKWPVLAYMEGKENIPELSRTGRWTFDFE
jgi:hypothetical protein